MRRGLPNPPSPMTAGRFRGLRRVPGGPASSLFRPAARSYLTPRGGWPHLCSDTGGPFLSSEGGPSVFAAPGPPRGEGIREGDLIHWWQLLINRFSCILAE